MAADQSEPNEPERDEARDRQRQKDRRSRFFFGLVLFVATVNIELVKNGWGDLGTALTWGFAVWTNYVAIVWISRFLS